MNLFLYGIFKSDIINTFPLMINTYLKNLIYGFKISYDFKNLLFNELA
jgi:hypothetical protein